MNTHPRFSGLV